MLARGIRSYHRPTRLDEALDLAARGVVPLAGGTRLLAAVRDLPNVLDLAGLGLGGIGIEDGDLQFGAMATLQDALDSPLADAGTAGLLPAAIRAQAPSPATRAMATLAGESVAGAHDSEVVAALLALNAVYVIAHPQEGRESPALRFLRNPAEDLAGGGLVTAIALAGAPGGAALERLAPTPSAPPVVAVAATVTFAGENCTRARIVVTGLITRPARVLEAEAQIERTPADETAVTRALSALQRAPFRSDAQGTAGYRLRVARVLAARALRTAIERARHAPAEDLPRARTTSAPRPLPALPYFTSGRVEITVNGKPVRAEIEARTTLVEALRREGLTGAKDGCGEGQCGACTVILDGRPTLSCLTLALRAQGRSVQTVEGMTSGQTLHPLQNAFLEGSAVLCGYCTPALLLQARALVDAVRDPTREQVEAALAGVRCRCTGGVRAVEAILEVARSRP
jgi:aerobic-type carbon monoxide dehydrogenase small subunit (CoxS/CutS family)/CO/xanthine dehydrogenase FAD-binding subunit